MKKKNSRKECGSVAVEATIILPIAILSVILLLYLSLFMFQRANLQACLETTLVYYKNTVTDTYVTKNNTLEYTLTEESSMASGNSYSATEPLNPYRGLFGDGHNLGDEDAFEAYFRSVAGNMLFDDNLTLTVDYSNYVIFKQLEVTATQIVDAPIDFSILGVDNEYEISAAARVNVIDHDDMIRNVDYAIDIVEDTKLGELARNFASKFGELYGEMKKTLGVE
ncbi:MAG: pilus assembly protein [Lachnospiraceae bacterium]|nr:pilus assembly protein [Lachnospiraceae bacterium]